MPAWALHFSGSPRSMPTVEATMQKRDTSNVYFNEPGRSGVYNRGFPPPRYAVSKKASRL
ncbi:hypothetical protein KSD_24060 [Ktedonobacter sp. SOSP1-85]|nr:hypothetical protein KSD_24060 [Ktedonobacter sp. SOSP1-85]